MAPYDKLRLGRHSQSGQAYFVTAVLARREHRLFEDYFCARMVIDQMRKLHDAGHVRSLAFVVMPDHAHWLFELGNPLPLGEVVRSLKAGSARGINRHLRRNGAIWQKNYFDRAIRKDEDLRTIARYIIANPLRAGLVAHIGEYPHWDAIWICENDPAEISAWG
ncbi:MAG TPA: transposase [Luteimonas sp.]|nr:transposase [Luteimonas sp.]